MTAAQLPVGGAREITWLENPPIVTNTNTNNCLWQIDRNPLFVTNAITSTNKKIQIQIQIQWLEKPLDCHNNQFDYVASVCSVASVCCQNEGFPDTKTFHFDNKPFHLLPKPLRCNNLNCFETPWMWQQLSWNPLNNWLVTPWMWQQLTWNHLNVTTIDLKPIECDISWVETTWMWQKLIWQLLMESNNLLCIHLKDLHCDNKRFELTLKQLVRVDFYNHLLLILLILSLWQKYVLALRSNLFQLFVTKVSALVLNCQIW